MYEQIKPDGTKWLVLEKSDLCNYDFDSMRKISTDEITGGNGNSFYQNVWDTKYQFKNGSSITIIQSGVARSKRKVVK